MKQYLLIVVLAAGLPAWAQDQEAESTALLAHADSLYTASNWKEAIAHYEKVLKKRTGDAGAWNRLGFSYHNVGEFRKAMEGYRKAVSANADSTMKRVIYSRMARTHAALNETDLAFEKLNMAVGHGYFLAGELESDKDYKSLKSDKRFALILERATRNAMPCLSRPQSREFDFWVGNWDVYRNGTDDLAGVSVIEVASGGCMILESWTSRGLVPYAGKSMNYVNPADGKWEQLWVGSDGVHRNNPQKFTGGEYREKAMRFTFEQWSPDGKKLAGRFTFFNEAPDRVRQLNEVSSDDGKTWTTVYDFIYRRTD